MEVHSAGKTQIHRASADRSPVGASALSPVKGTALHLAARLGERVPDGFVPIVLAAAMTLVLSACGDGEENAPNASKALGGNEAPDIPAPRQMQAPAKPEPAIQVDVDPGVVRVGEHGPGNLGFLLLLAALPAALVGALLRRAPEDGEHASRNGTVASAISLGVGASGLIVTTLPAAASLGAALQPLLFLSAGITAGALFALRSHLPDASKRALDAVLGMSSLGGGAALFAFQPQVHLALPESTALVFGGTLGVAGLVWIASMFGQGMEAAGAVLKIPATLLKFLFGAVVEAPGIAVPVLAVVGGITYFEGWAWVLSLIGM